MQMRVLENPFSKYKKFALFCAAVGHELLQKTTARYQYLPFEATVNFPNYPLRFKRQITLSAVLSSRTRSHLSATVGTIKMNCVLILDENHGVINQHNDEKAASNGGAKVGLDS